MDTMDNVASGCKANTDLDSLMKPATSVMGFLVGLLLWTLNPEFSGFVCNPKAMLFEIFLKVLMSLGQLITCEYKNAIT